MLMLRLVVHLIWLKRDSCTVAVLTCFVICDCVGVLVICVLLFTVFLYCFIYVYLFLFRTSVRTTVTERKLSSS